jgi:hypothetical protein
MKSRLINSRIAIGMLSLPIWMFTACKPAQDACSVTEAQRKQITSEIETTVRNGLNASTLNYETHTGFRANEPGYIMAGDGKVRFASYNDYNEAMKKSFKNIVRFTAFNIHEIYTYVLSKDAATSTIVFTGSYLRPSGATEPDNGCWTFVFKKFSHGWKVVQENGTHLK